MNKKKMIVNTRLELLDYVNMVEEIASEYFDSDGEYQPQIGILNTMRLFYNKCILKSKFDEQINHDTEEPLDVGILVADDEFISKFNAALVGDGMVCLDFANAYRDAMEIVDTKKTSIGNIINSIKKGVSGIVDMLSPTLSDENIANISRIAQDISNGKIGAESIVEAYANSQRLKNIANED